MTRLTNTDLHNEIKLVTQELNYVKDSQAKMQEDVTMIKKVILNPDGGTISRVNRNTQFRKNTQKVLWSIWIVILGIIGKMIFWE
jgi:hypothetical protein|tara:strand:+ start:216 stop:470 length:255 start_codon:yes stop_codon:yes gene_type:complete